MDVQRWERSRWIHSVGGIGGREETLSFLDCGTHNPQECPYDLSEGERVGV